MSRTQSDIPYLHVARVAACVAVITNHVVAPHMLLLGKIPIYIWWLSTFITSSVFWAVPIFVMISGALLLRKEKNESIADFYRKRFFRVGIPLVFWVVLYFVFFHFWRGTSLSPAYMIKNVLFNRGLDNLYFLFIILELYLITPFLREILIKLSKRQFLFLSLLFLFIAIFWREQLFVGTMFVPYIGYYVLGSYLHQHLSYKDTRLLVVLFIGLITVISILEYLFISHTIYNFHNDFFFYVHSNPLIISLSTVAFLLFRNLPSIPASVFSYIKQFSTVSFGIYLFHYPIHTILLKVFFTNEKNIAAVAWYMFLPLIVLVFVLSYCCTKLIQKVPVLRILV